PTDTRPYALLGDPSEAQLLVPVDSWAAASKTVARRTNAMDTVERVRRAAAGLAIRTGLASRRLSPTIYVAGRSSDGSTLHEYLADVLGRPSVSLSVAFGPPRPNQKPIVTVMDEAAEIVAYAKLGWNSATRDLVVHEANFLTEAADSPMDGISIPRPLHLGQWRDVAVSVAASVESARFSAWRAPLAEDFAAVANLACQPYEARWEASPHRARIESALAEATWTGAAAEAGALAEAVAVITNDQVFRFGRWHGDWTPWNTGTQKHRLVLWDWERPATDVPVGLDVIHNEFQPLFSDQSNSAHDALQTALAKGSQTLRALGIPPAMHRDLGLIYLLELLARFIPHAEADADGAAVTVDRLTRGLGTLLTP
ncbi:MAG: hypothetical protein ACR2NL_03690, partial [Acidimicrobiia bacterium]